MNQADRDRHAARMRLENLPRRIEEMKHWHKALKEAEARKLYDQAQADFKLIGKKNTLCPAPTTVNTHQSGFPFLYEATETSAD